LIGWFGLVWLVWLVWFSLVGLVWFGLVRLVWFGLVWLVGRSIRKGQYDHGLKRLRTSDLDECETDEPSRLTETGFQAEISDARREFQERHLLQRRQNTSEISAATAFKRKCLVTC
jgi:hypothetical protein